MQSLDMILWTLVWLPIWITAQFFKVTIVQDDNVSMQKTIDI